MTTNWQDPTEGPPPPNPPVGGQTPPNKKRFAIVATLLVVIAGLATAAGLVMVNRGDDTAENPQYVATEIASTTPVFEPKDAAGNDPFFALSEQVKVYKAEVEQEIDQQVELARADAEEGEVVVRPEFDVAALDAAVKTGLYGGTAENTCDPERLISFLYANPEKAAAWAKVQNIEVNEIATYIRSLEVRELGEDLRTINHGFDEQTGAAYEIDTVLEAGTAVLVDEDGNVRARCYCGNPIKPRMPEHMPPRCIVYGAFVFLSPGGNDKRDPGTRDVLLTGRQTVLADSSTWIEVKWGADASQTGWVRSNHLKKHYCPTPTGDRYCPGPGLTKTYHSSDGTDPVGRVTGQVRLVDTSIDMFAPIAPVGGFGGEIIENDFMLIEHTEPAPSVQNSSWVKLADLNQDETECYRVRQCIDTNGPVLDRSGGVAIPGADGVIRAEFTGHFAGDPFVNHAEIRLNNGSGAYGWIDNLGYIPLADEACEPPTYDCPVDAQVYEQSTGFDIVGYVDNSPVTILDGPQDGRIQVMLGAGGPTGWIDVGKFFNGWDKCHPQLVCAITTDLAWTEYQTEGVSIPAIAAPRMIEEHGQWGIDGVNNFTLIGVDGTDYWIDVWDFIVVADEECRPSVPECPQLEYLSAAEAYLPGIRDPRTLDDRVEMVQDMNPDDEIVPWSECCVSALYNTPDTTDIAVTPVPIQVVVIDEFDIGGTTWYLTAGGFYFRLADRVFFGDCEPADCPNPWTPGSDDDGRIKELGDLGVLTLALESDTVGMVDAEDARALLQPERDRLDRPDASECCVTALYDAPGGAPVAIGTGTYVDVVGGPVGVLPAWYLTSSGLWFPETAVTNAGDCMIIDCPANSGIPGDNDLLSRYPSTDTDLTGLLSTAEVVATHDRGDIATCCVSGDLFGEETLDTVIDTLAEPTPVVVFTHNMANDSYGIATVGLAQVGWVGGDQFVDLNECRNDGGECPRLSIVTIVESLQTETGLAYECCVSFTVGVNFGAEVMLLTGKTRIADGGETEYETIDGGWLPESLFVSAAECQDDTVCPFEGSIISPNDPSTCCVAVGNGFEVVSLTGETRLTEGGEVEYLATDGEWYEATDFVGAGRCDQEPCDGQLLNGQCCEAPNEVVNGQCVPPCPNGQDRNPNGGCDEPAVACPPGQVLNAADQCVTPRTPCADGEIRDNADNCVPAGCSDIDSDDVCDPDDNCIDVANQNQTDTDQDGDGDACDPCTDTDQDFFCESPGDPNNDNCWGVYNTDQSDRDQDGVGDVCDVCPSVSNPDQSYPFDSDGDGVGDTCSDPCPLLSSAFASGDRDGDGVCDVDDNCVDTPNPGQSDRDDFDGYGDACDICPDVYNPDQSYPYDTDGDRVGDSCVEPECGQGDSDNDGACNGQDNCSQVPNPGQQDSDGDGFGNACDNCPNLYNSGQVDTDGDGHGDGCDFCPGSPPWNADDEYNPDQGFLYDSNNDGINDTCYLLF